MEVKGLLYGAYGGPIFDNVLDLWVPFIGSGQNERITPDVLSGIEDHIGEITSEEDMRRVIHELNLRR